jgi:hypothetical protein
METLLQFLGLSGNFFSQCEIYINDDIIPNGFGLIINKYVLTLDHIITDKNIYINKTKYNILYKIEEYDIIVLHKSEYVGNIDEFLNEFIDNIEYMNISRMDKHMNTQFKIFKSNLILILNRIENTSLKSNILPEILLGKFNIIPNKFINNTSNLAGFSGSVCYKDNKIFGLLVSQNDDDIEVMPIEIIYDLLKIHSKHGLRYFPVNIYGNIINSSNNLFCKNDMINKINNIQIDEFGMIYYKKYNHYIPIQTFLLLYDNNKIIINVIRNRPKVKKEIIINYKLEKFAENKIKINIKENNKQIIIKNLCFKELSEDYLIKIHNDKKIHKIDYENIYTNKKLLYLANDDSIDCSSLLLLKKISGHKINNLNQINHFITQKKCVIELLNPNNEIIKLNI